MPEKYRENLTEADLKEIRGFTPALLHALYEMAMGGKAVIISTGQGHLINAPELDVVGHFAYGFNDYKTLTDIVKVQKERGTKLSIMLHENSRY